MSVNEEALMWVEKYRPKTLDDVVGLKDIVESLKAFMKNPKTMPHLDAGRHSRYRKNHNRSMLSPTNCTEQTGETSHLNLTLPMREALTLCGTELKISHVTAAQALATSPLH